MDGGLLPSSPQLLMGVSTENVHGDFNCGFFCEPFIFISYLSTRVGQGLRILLVQNKINSKQKQMYDNVRLYGQKSNLKFHDKSRPFTLVGYISYDVSKFLP